jgi:hypothetical protein
MVCIAGFRDELPSAEVVLSPRDDRRTLEACRRDLQREYR